MTPRFPTSRFSTPGSGAPSVAPVNFNAIAENAIPGFGGLTTGASNIVGNLMGGLPSAAPTQRANAYFGVGSGIPGSDFVRNRGFDLYGEQAEAYKQRGFDNFLKMLQGYSGTVAPTTGQSIQDQQFQADLAFRNKQADAQNALEQRQLNLRKKPSGFQRWMSGVGANTVPGGFTPARLS
jgi:hypothetical protein